MWERPRVQRINPQIRPVVSARPTGACVGSSEEQGWTLFQRSNQEESGQRVAKRGPQPQGSNAWWSRCNYMIIVIEIGAQ